MCAAVTLPSLSSPPCGWCGLKYCLRLYERSSAQVTTLRVVWIEIMRSRSHRYKTNVTTLRVVWIEIIIGCGVELYNLSPPCGWCGLKFLSVLGGAVPQQRHHLAGGVD